MLADVGNARIKWASFSDVGLFDHGCTPYGGVDAPPLCAVFSEHWSNEKPPRRLVIANVGGPRVGDEISAWTTASWGLEPEFITSPASGWGVTNAYREPATLGADRWAVLVAAHHGYSGPLCIVDCGTALTIDVLDESGRHQGGLIMPGVALMRRSLLEHTHDIEEVNGGVASLASSTADAVAAGTVGAAVAAVERVMDDVRSRFEAPPTCVLTGGDAEFLHASLSIECRLQHDLVLQGLAIMAGGKS